MDGRKEMNVEQRRIQCWDVDAGYAAAREKYRAWEAWNFHWSRGRSLHSRQRIKRIWRWLLCGSGQGEKVLPVASSIHLRSGMNCDTCRLHTRAYAGAKMLIMVN